MIDNAQYGYATFAGVSLTGTEILLKYTWVGDADLNGVVNGDDFTQFAFGFNGGTPTWLNGDFDYNVVVNGDDFTLFAAGFNGQSAQLRPEEMAAVSGQVGIVSAASGAGAQAVVPEPASLAWLAVGAFGLASRRRRQCES